MKDGSLGGGLSGRSYESEAELQTVFGRWVRGGSGVGYSVLGSVAFCELKYTRGERLGLMDRDVKVHQRDSLMRSAWGIGLDLCGVCGDVCGATLCSDVLPERGARGGAERSGLVYKISDASPELKPFDCFIACGGVNGFIVVAFRGGGVVLAVEILAYEKMRCALLVAGKRSCTVADCLAVGAVVL